MTLDIDPLIHPRLLCPPVGDDVKGVVQRRHGFEIPRQALAGGWLGAEIESQPVDARSRV